MNHSKKKKNYLLLITYYHFGETTIGNLTFFPTNRPLIPTCILNLFTCVLDIIPVMFLKY